MYIFLKAWIKDTFLYYFIRNAYRFIGVLSGSYSFNLLLSDIESQLSRNRIRFFQSLYVNFRSLNFKDAIKIPIVTYSNLNIQSLQGRILFKDCVVQPMMIELGVFQRYRSQGVTRINNKGQIIFHGKGKILRGAELMTYPDAIIEFGDSFFVGENVMIYAAEHISMGKSSRISYHSQICDSDFHFMINIENGTIKNRTKPIFIGDFNWIANNVTIKKGTRTPDHITAAGSYTVLLKDYTKEVPPYSILAGNPARCLCTGYSRIWKNEKQRIFELAKFFKDNPLEIIYKIKPNECYCDYSF